MRSPIRYVVYPWWPEGGDAWLHADDVATARRMIPSRRVFFWEGDDGTYRVLRYGRRRLRVLPALWLPVRGDGLDVGQWVEIGSRLGRNRPGIGRIGQMLWNDRFDCIDYRVRRRDMLLPTTYRFEDLAALEHMTSGGLSPGRARPDTEGKKVGQDP